MKLYFYTSLETAKLIIESGTLALSPPATFNDPFDCLPLGNDNDLNKAINVLNGYIIDVALFKNSASKINNNKNFFYKNSLKSIALAYKIFRKSAVKSNGPYIPLYTVNSLMKLVDFLIKISKKSKKELIKFKEDFSSGISKLETEEKIILNQIFQIRDSLYVACLSEKNDSILMWSYYGDKHRGACIEFDIDEDKAHLFKVQYKKIRPQIQYKKVIEEYCGRLFAEIKNELISKDEVIINLLALPYITKSIEWKHEHEYRYIFSEKELTERGIKTYKDPNGIERYLYPMPNINKVFLGANTSVEEKEELKRFCETLHKNIEFITMVISDKEYLLSSQSQ